MKRTAEDQALFERALEFIWQPKKAHTEKDFELFRVLAAVQDGLLLARILCQLDKESLLRACQVSQLFNQICQKYQIVERRYDGHLFIYIGTQFKLLAGESDQFDQEKVVSVACSSKDIFCIFATESGRLFKFHEGLTKEIVIPNNEKAIRVYCNDAEVVFITTAGNAYAFRYSWDNPIEMSLAISNQPTLITTTGDNPIEMSLAISNQPTLITTTGPQLFFIQGALNNYSVCLLTDEGRFLNMRMLDGQVRHANITSNKSKIVDISMNDNFLVANHEHGYSSFYIMHQMIMDELIYKDGGTFTVVQPHDLLMTKNGQDYYIPIDQLGMPLSDDMIIGSDTKYMHKTKEGEIRLTRKNQLFIDGKPFDFKMGVSQVAIGYNISVLIAHLDPIMPLVCGQCGAENPPYFAGDNVYCGEECVKVSFKAAYGISNSVQGNQSCGGRCHIP